MLPLLAPFHALLLSVYVFNLIIFQGFQVRLKIQTRHTSLMKLFSVYYVWSEVKTMFWPNLILSMFFNMDNGLAALTVSKTMQQYLMMLR